MHINGVPKERVHNWFPIFWNTKNSFRKLTTVWETPTYNCSFETIKASKHDKTNAKSKVFWSCLKFLNPQMKAKTAKINFWSQKDTSQKVFCHIDLCSKLLQNLKNLSPKTWVNWVLFSGWNQNFSFCCSRHITRMLRCTARGCLEFKLFSQHGAVEKRKKVPEFSLDVWR